MTLNFHSHHPLLMRKNVAYNLFYRAITLSDGRFHNDNIKKVSEILKENSYPPNIISQQLHKVLTKINNVANTQIDNRNLDTNQMIIRRGLTYDKSVSEILSKEIRLMSEDKIHTSGKPFNV